MDITKLAVSNTAAIHLKSADGELLYDGEKAVRIVFYGPGSREYGVVESRQSARAIKRMNDNDSKITAAPYEERIAETAQDLAAITVRLENLDYPPAQGKEGVELFEALYRDPTLGFIVKQVVKAVADWGNFKPGSATG